MISRSNRLCLFFSLCFLCTVAFSCSGNSALEAQKLEILTSGGATVPLVTEIARTEAEQHQGYMGRKTIPDGTAMIFVFHQDQKMYFWMKDTPHPLSIAFIDSSGMIREIRDMVPFSLETLESELSVRYALEVPAGWFGRAGIAIGDRLSPESLNVINTAGKKK